MNTDTRTRLAILGTRGIPARYGGFETFAEELACRLVAQGVDVTVYCEQDAGVDQPGVFRGVKLVHLPAPACGPLTTILFDLCSLWHARKGYDVVYMLGYGAAPFCFIPRLWGSRVWLNVDGIEWARDKWNSVAKLYFKAMEFFSMITPNRVIADAFAIRDHLQRRHTRQMPISVIPYGAPLIETPPDVSQLSAWNLVPDGYYLIVCRLEPENHVREMLQGFAASASRRELIVVANHTTGTAYVQSLLQVADPRIRFIGTVFDKEKLQALRYHAYAYCHGHSVGGTNPSLLEALGCGNAVIAHDNPFNREVAGDAGIYFRSFEAFVLCIQRLEAQMNNRRQRQQIARQVIRNRYAWETVAAAYLELLYDKSPPRVVRP